MKMVFAFMLTIVAPAAFAINPCSPMSSVSLNEADYSHVPGYDTGVDVKESEGVRDSLVSNEIGEYRNQHGQDSLPRGTLISQTYLGGSQECLTVASKYSDVQALVIVGTQFTSNGTWLGTTGTGSIGGGGGGGGGTVFGGIIFQTGSWCVKTTTTWSDGTKTVEIDCTD
jgi:hypothetical protein